MTFPKISIITPSFNQANYLETSINSVLKQNYPNLEYIIIDGGSTDGSLDIIERYTSKLTYWISEPDEGHANALNKGFAKTTGEIMGWLNSDDILHPGALSLLAEIFSGFDEVDWLTGQSSFIDPSGRIVMVHSPARWSRLRFLSGDYKWIQQESTYWRRRLWDKVGGTISEEYSMACDFELWVRFFRYAKLYSMDGLIGAFRFNPNQRTRTAMDIYQQEIQQILMREIAGLGPININEDTWWAKSLVPLKYNWQLNHFENPNK
jgi:glycosyltransferase involved in cell wall biosynthesis